LLPYNFFERVIYEIDLKNTFPDDFSPPIVLYEPELSGSFYFTMLHPSNQSLTNLKNPAKGTKGILVNGGSPLSRDFLLVYTLKTTKEANTGASFSINGIKVADLTTRTPNNIIEICGCVRAFKGDIITTHVASAGGYADVYAYC
jgi:hypothetical protein